MGWYLMLDFTVALLPHTCYVNGNQTGKTAVSSRPHSRNELGETYGRPAN